MRQKRKKDMTESILVQKSGLVLVGPATATRHLSLHGHRQTVTTMIRSRKNVVYDKGL